jgi:hypothetical protein
VNHELPTPFSESRVEKWKDAMKNSVNSADITVGQQLADFLDAQSILRRESANCESCGSKMQYRELQFWLAGTRMTWNIRLPVCASCAQAKVHKPLGLREAA